MKGRIRAAADDGALREKKRKKNKEKQKIKNLVICSLDYGADQLVRGVGAGRRPKSHLWKGRREEW